MNLELFPFGSNKHEQLNNFSLEMHVGCPFAESFNIILIILIIQDKF